ncbi:MAG: ADYC domain-containing protein [Pleurocapsa sp. MO_226.B13]|nr:ADYC domain-containing protein [Pleurocapsa sp. MO_226.B13]
MRTFFLSLIVGGIYSIGMRVVDSHPSLANTPTTTRRAEPVLQEQAKAQGYQLSEPELDPQDRDREVYLYTINYQDPNNSQWHNLCQPDADNLAKAMLLSGEWDETGAHIDNDRVTVACTSSVLAKCVRWGYKPWQTVQGVSLRDYHQTCTRMARADYCGNGISHTKDGTAIDLYDRLGIQQPEPQEDREMLFEAAWGVDGAVLLARTRYPEGLAQLQSECPEKLAQIVSDNQTLSNEEAQQPAAGAMIFNSSLQVNEKMRGR